MSLLLSFHTMSASLRRRMASPCLCDSPDASRCACGGTCGHHLGPVTRALLGMARVLARRPRRVPRPTFAIVPHGRLLWGGVRPVTVRCERCGSVLRSGQTREVRQLTRGRWEHVDCGTVARVPKGGGGLARLLAQSIVRAV
jgi:hypothetical protein